MEGLIFYLKPSEQPVFFHMTKSSNSKYKIVRPHAPHPPIQRNPLRIVVETPPSQTAHCERASDRQGHVDLEVRSHGPYAHAECFPMRKHLQFRLHKRQMCPGHSPPAGCLPSSSGP